MKKVLVTGGAGFIGSHCVDQLLAAGHQVVVFDKKSKDEAVNLSHCLDQVVYHTADLSDFSALVGAMSGCDQVIHLAAFVSVPGSIESPVAAHNDNVTGTLHVFESMKKLGIDRGIYASSAAVYGVPEGVPVSEESKLNPCSPYGFYKQANEQYAEFYREEYGLKLTGLRFFNVYGERQDPRSPYSGVISIFLDRIENDEPIIIYGDGEATRDFVYVGDVAAVCVESAVGEVEWPQVCNVGTGQETTLNSLIDTICKITDKKAQKTNLEARTGDIVHSCADVKLLTKTSDAISTVNLEDGLRKMIS